MTGTIDVVRYPTPGRSGRRATRPVAVLAASALAVAALVQCSSVPPAEVETSVEAPSAAPPTETSNPGVAPAPPPVQSPPAEPSAATTHPITAAELGASWRRGCPVEPNQLRRVNLAHIDFEGRTQRGDLVLHRDLVPEVIAIFDELYRMGYPIAKMRALDHYPDASDELSMEDNNTSAFNCRRIPGSGSWSLHAYGRAIDINPVLNPFIDRSGAVEPTNAAPYVDRRRVDPGTLHDGGSAVRAFTQRGWKWGGHWRTPLDYQHFERQ